MAAAVVSFSSPPNSPPIRRATVRPFAAVLSISRGSAPEPFKMRSPYELKSGQNRQFHTLPSGLKMEVIFQGKNDDNAKAFPTISRNNPEARKEDMKAANPPLVFVHGSYHAAWCWAEHWLPFFSEHGYDCYAVSLLGQGESDAPADKVAGSLQTHASDIAHFIQERLPNPPVLLGHSFGGLVVQNYIAYTRKEHMSGSVHPELAGAVLVCSVPPSGTSGMVWRYLFSKPIAAFKVTRSLAAKAFRTSLPLCRETFFSPQMEDWLVERYQGLLGESSRMPLFDLKKLNASLPVAAVPESSIELLVLGAAGDMINDAEAIYETGRFYGVSPVFVEGVAHDMMLDCSWDRGAKVILSWLDSLKTRI